MDYGLPRADEVCSFEMDENPVPTKTLSAARWSDAGPSSV